MMKFEENSASETGTSALAATQKAVPQPNAYQLLEKSGLDYTTLRLPWLNDRPEVKYSITHRHDTYVGVSGSRQSMADVVLKIVADPTFGSRDSLGIADPDTDGLTRPVY